MRDSCSKMKGKANKTAVVFRFAHVSSGCDTSWL